ncbi:response regulator transcription factor [Streptomyces bungoensis]
MDHAATPVPHTLLRPDGTPARILVVDDEPDAEYVMSAVLRRQGWLVRSAVDGAGAVAHAERFRPDAVLLDVLLPDIDGVEVARRIRAFLPGVCVLFLTACDVRDAGIPTGDACLTKPVALEDVVVRLRFLLRRAGLTWPESRSDPAASRLTVADLVMDETTREVTRGGDPVDLTANEFALLRFLMRNPGRIHSATQILDHVWSHDFGDRSHVVALSVGYLRRKIDTGREPLLHTVPGPGYLLRPDLP